MNLTEKYRPKTEEDWVGDRVVLEGVLECVKNLIPVILEGPPGSGKTSLIRVIANKLNYEIIETNASDERKKIDLKDLSIRLRTHTFNPVIYSIEEVDGLENQDFLADIIKYTIHPIILTANENHKLSLKLKKVCKQFEVALNFSYLGLVVKRMQEIAEKEGLKVTYEKVTTDVRESINAVFGGSQGYEKEENYFEKIVDIFKKGEVRDIPIIWLIDNVHNFYYGKDLYDTIKILADYSVTGNKNLLGCLPRAKKGKPSYPYYLKKLKVNNHA